MSRPEPISLTLADVQAHIKTTAGRGGLCRVGPARGAGSGERLPARWRGFSNQRRFNVWDERDQERYTLKYWLERWLANRQASRKAGTHEPSHPLSGLARRSRRGVYPPAWGTYPHDDQRSHCPALPRPEEPANSSLALRKSVAIPRRLSVISCACDGIHSSHRWSVIRTLTSVISMYSNGDIGSNPVARLGLLWVIISPLLRNTRQHWTPGMSVGALQTAAGISRASAQNYHAMLTAEKAAL